MPRGKAKPESKIARESSLLGEEFCSFVDGAPEDKLRDALKQLPLDRVNLQERQKADADLSEAKQRVSTASQPYREGFKRIDLKAQWIRRRLQSMGKPVGDDSEQADQKLDPASFDKLGGPKPAPPTKLAN